MTPRLLFALRAALVLDRPGVAMTRPAHLIAAELAALQARSAELHTELAHALAALAAPAPERPAAAPAEYLTTAEAAEMLGVSVRHLERLRAAGDGPPTCRVGRAVRYRRATLEGYAAAARVPGTNAARALAVQLPSAAPSSDPYSEAGPCG